VIIITAEKDDVAAGTTTAQIALIIPDGYVKCVGLWVNPTIDYTVSMLSQKTKVLLMDGFRTQIGVSGFIPFNFPFPSGERLLFTFKNNTLALQNLFTNVMVATANE